MGMMSCKRKYKGQPYQLWNNKMLQKQISYVVFGIGESNQGSENMKTQKLRTKKHIPEVLGIGGPAKSLQISFFFFKVLFVFGFLDGVLPKESPDLQFFMVPGGGAVQNRWAR